MKETYLDYHYDYIAPETEWLFVTPSLDSRDLQLQVQEVGHMIQTGNHYTHRGPLESYQIGFAMGDTSGTLRFRGKRFPFLRKSEVLFLDCTRGYSIETQGDGDTFFVHFWSPAVAYYSNLFLKQNDGCPILRQRSQVVQTNIRKLLEIYHHPNTREDDLSAEMLIMEMVTDVLKLTIPENRHIYSEYVERAIKVIHECYASDINLDMLAERVFLSKYYLSHIFKKEVGVTPASYIQRYRIGKAKELLVTTRLSQEEICDRVGLYSGSYLSKLFRTYEGLTPDQYRKKWTK